ncbi:MAG: hypothetical protein K2J82_06295 [Muribaculaceae bacterium]|nr:hypothetical protein [Muribaculaceae bacterium]
MNKNFIKIASTLTLILTVSVIYVACGGSNGDSGSEDGSTEGDGSQTELAEQPETVKILIDKSGSMKGYFNSKDMQSMMSAITAMQDLGKEKGSIKFDGDPKPIQAKSNADGILATTNFNKDTDMAKIIENSIEYGGDSIPVAIITDGIVSTPQGKNDIPQMISDIKRALMNKNSNLGWMIFRGESNYDGIYYVESQKPSKKVNLKISERPFYIILVGPKPQIRYIINKTKENEKKWDEEWECEWLAFNSHDDHSDLKFYVSTNTDFTELGDYYYKLNTSNSEKKISLIADIPSCLYDIVKSKKILQEHGAVVTINGTTISNWSTYFQDNQLTLEVPSNDLQINAGDGETTLTLSFSANPTNKWTHNYSSDDDSNILSDSDQQKRTYQLKSLLEPMSDATKNHEVKITFKYTD